MTARDYDAIVIGAGPAGCAVARLLAAWKHRVLLVDRPGGQSRLLAESIPPSTQKVLAALGTLQAIEDAGFMPWRGNTVWWGDDSPRIETFPPAAAGYQVDRARFDALLRRLAEQSGADVRTGLVRDVRLAGDADADEHAVPSVTIETAGETTHASARFILDCSGRTGSLARRGLRHADSPARTVALAGRWTDERGFGGIDHTHTLVASYADGWAWSVATSPSMRHVTVMVDPERTDLARGESALEVYRTEVGKVRAFATPDRGGPAERRAVGRGRLALHGARVRGPRFPPRRRRRIVHRSALVVRREEGARLRVARCHRHAHRAHVTGDA